MSKTQEHHLPFEDKYTYQHAQQYYKKHKKSGLRKDMVNAVEMWMAKRALHMAGNPKTVLDLPCGFGRFWPSLIDAGVEKIIASDKSTGMLQVSQEISAPEVLSHVKTMPSSATEIDLQDKSVDSVLCMRLLHHISDREYRLAIYRSFQRVARDTVIISYWMKNSWRYAVRKKNYENKDLTQINSHFISHEELMAEFAEAGFEVIGHTDMFPYISPWRSYVLKVKK